MSLPGLGGGSSSPSGIESALTGLVPQFQQYASNAAALEPNFLDLSSLFQGISSNFLGEGGQIYGPAFNQYSAGAAGQVTPDQQTAIDQTLQQMNLQTKGTYGNLGLGGSTMETQDVNANTQKSLAQKSAFETLDEQLGLAGLGTSLNYGTAGTNALTGATNATQGALNTQTGAGNILAGAAGTLNQAGNIATQQQQLSLGLLGQLGGALGGSQGLLGKLGLGGSGYGGGGIGGYTGAGAGYGASAIGYGAGAAATGGLF